MPYLSQENGGYKILKICENQTCGLIDFDIMKW